MISRLCAFPSGTGREDRDSKSNSRREHDYFEFSSQHGVYPAGSLRQAFPHCADRSPAFHHRGAGWTCDRVNGRFAGLSPLPRLVSKTARGLLLFPKAFRE